VREIIRQRTYTGTHMVEINGGTGSIEHRVPAVVDPAVRQRPLAARGKQALRWRAGPSQLPPLGTHRVPGIAVGHTGELPCPPPASASTTTLAGGGGPATISKYNPRPYVAAEWLERLVWQDVRGFLEDAGEVLERLREQLNGGDQANELEERRESLEKRLANKPGESDRAIRLYMRGPHLRRGSRGVAGRAQKRGRQLQASHKVRGERPLQARGEQVGSTDYRGVAHDP
jgi:hypothetical protein